MPVISLQVRTRQERVLEEITDLVQQGVRQSGITEGQCVVYVPHTTAGLVVSENYDPTVAADILATLERLVPEQGPYRHGEGNAAAHIRAALAGASHAFIVQGGRVLLGTWQGIFLAEFDGPRQRRVLISIQPSAGQ